MLLAGPLGGQAAEKLLEWVQDKGLSWLHGSSGIDWPKNIVLFVLSTYGSVNTSLSISSTESNCSL